MREGTNVSCWSSPKSNRAQWCYVSPVPPLTDIVLVESCAIVVGSGDALVGSYCLSRSYHRQSAWNVSAGYTK